MITKLTETFQPTHYDLNLIIDSQALSFNGTVTLTGSLTENAAALPLHVKELSIESCKINDDTAEFAIDEENDVLSITTSKLDTSGAVEAEITFSGKITDAMHGMYPCYFEHEGKKKKLIATQFESHHAREVFPCIDEPAAKATFAVTLRTDEGETVLSNMPVKEQMVANSRQITVFETTPVMSTYLLAFVVGEMVSKEAKTKDGVIVRSWASAAQDAAWLDYSVRETVALIEFYNDYFGVPYPLAKCDQVALPDFESGAMENWGLITYRETVLLSDPKNPSLSTQQWITLVVAHELSHQWFGNLVTMQWWDDLWLNESFANMTEYLAADGLHPEWNIWEEFIASDAASATNRDVYKDVQAVRVEVINPSEIHTLFDPAIVYAKGGKLLKMLHDLVGDDAWRSGLKDYFEKNAYKNTTRDDLWDALNAHTDIDIPSLMNTWIEKPGQPLITVKQDGATVTLSQQRLLLDGEDTETLWQVPLLAGNNTLKTLDSKQQTYDLETEDWAIINQTGVGHYITNYTNETHKKILANLLSNDSSSSTWKITRLNELIMLARSGNASLAEALETIKSSGSEQRAMVWALINGILGNAHMLTYENEIARKTLKKLSGALAQKNFEKLGWEYAQSDGSNEIHLRTNAIGMMIASEQDEVIQTALNKYRAAKDPENDLPAESRNKIIAVAAKFGTDEEFETILEAYIKSQNADYKADLCAALTATKDPSNIAQLLDLILDTKVIRPQDTIRWYIYLLRNRHARKETWQWLKDNWQWIMETFGGSKSYDDFARYSANVLGSKEMLDEYVTFFAPMKDDPALKRAIAVGTEELKARVAWRERDEVAVTDWLTQYSQQNS